MFRSRVVRMVFGSEKEEVKGKWTKLHNEEPHVLYFSPDIIWVIRSRAVRWVEHVEWMGKKRNAYRVLAGKSEGKRLLGRPMCE